MNYATKHVHTGVQRQYNFNFQYLLRAATAACLSSRHRQRSIYVQRQLQLSTPVRSAARSHSTRGQMGKWPNCVKQHHFTAATFVIIVECSSNKLRVICSSKSWPTCHSRTQLELAYLQFAVCPGEHARKKAAEMLEPYRHTEALTFFAYTAPAAVPETTATTLTTEMRLN